MRIDKPKTKEWEIITASDDFRVGEFLIEKGDRFVVLNEKDDKKESILDRPSNYRKV